MSARQRELEREVEREKLKTDFMRGQVIAFTAIKMLFTKSQAQLGKWDVPENQQWQKDLGIDTHGKYKFHPSVRITTWDPATKEEETFTVVHVPHASPMGERNYSYFVVFDNGEELSATIQDISGFLSRGFLKNVYAVEIKTGDVLPASFCRLFVLPLT